MSSINLQIGTSVTRLKSNTKGAVTLRLQVRAMVTKMHLCKTTINNNIECEQLQW